ncbi:MAG: hypothetical protein J6X60_00975, partial [Ruminiclostridium sp.]|nr:hypothetical protein [Ruminiclostridium sp.]
MPAQLKELFENIEFGGNVGEGTVLAIVDREKEGSVLLQTQFPERVPFSELFDAADRISAELGIKKASIYPKYDPSLFDADAALDITSFLRREGYNVNGYFDDAEVSLDGNHVSILLRQNGASLLLGAGIDNEIRKFAKGFYGVDITVTF